MVEDVIKNLIVPVFQWCAKWTDDLLGAISGKGVVLGIFLIVLVIGLLFIPMRGNSVTGIKLYAESKIHSKRRQKQSSAKEVSKKG